MTLICFFHYRTKRRTDKQYHSDDGYTSDPGIIREVSSSLIPSPWCTKPSIMFSLVNSICTNTKSWVGVVFYLYIHDQHSELVHSICFTPSGQHKQYLFVCWGGQYQGRSVHVCISLMPSPRYMRCTCILCQLTLFCFGELHLFDQHARCQTNCL